MRCPRLDELPPSPPGKIGWPWTKESPELPDTMPEGHPWPKVSIVTPSYNQGQFLEETIRSVLLQGYPNLEYIIIDGGSNDNSVEIIKKYEKWLAYWISEKDRGQADAINKGWRRSKGEFVGYLNSDDLLLPHAISRSVEHLCAHPDILLCFGDCYYVDEMSRQIGYGKGASLDLVEILTGTRKEQGHWIQPGSLMRRSLLDTVGYLNPELQWGLDSDYLYRVLLHGKVGYSGFPVAKFRLYEGCKTQSFSKDYIKEAIIVWEGIWSNPALPERLKGRRNEVFSHMYLEMARQYFLGGHIGMARKYLFKAWVLYPKRIIEKRSLVIAAATTICSPFSLKFVQWRRKRRSQIFKSSRQ